MFQPRLFPWALGAALALTMAATDVQAQGPGRRGAESSRAGARESTQAPRGPEAGDNGEGGPSPFEDPAAQLRMLRRRVSGGRGNGMIDLLLDSTALQEEIGIADEQQANLRLIKDQVNNQRRDMFREMRNNRGGGRGGRGGQGGQGGFAQFGQAMAAMNQQAEAAVSKVLSRQQIQRLSQIELQILGPAVIVERPEVAARLNLNPIQQQQLADIKAQKEQAERQLRDAQRNAMRGMFGGPGGPGGPGGFGPGGPGGPNAGNRNAAAAPGGANRDRNANNNRQRNNDDEDEDNNNNNQGGGRFNFSAEQRQAMADRFRQNSEQEQALTEKFETAIGKVLSPQQRRSFIKLQGTPFNLALLIQPPGGDRRRGNGGNNGDGGQNQQADDNASETGNAPRAARAGGRRP